MKKAFRIFFIVCLSVGFVYAQKSKIQFADIVKAFNTFEYKEVVGKSELLLKQD